MPQHVHLLYVPQDTRVESLLLKRDRNATQFTYLMTSS